MKLDDTFYISFLASCISQAESANQTGNSVAPALFRESLSRGAQGAVPGLKEGFDIFPLSI